MNWTTDLIRCHQYFHEYPLLFQDPIHIAFSYYCSSGTSNLRQYVGLSLHCMTLTLSNSTGQVFCRLSAIWICLMFFFITLWVWGSYHQGEVAFSVNHFRVYMTSAWFITSDITLITRVCQISQLYSYYFSFAHSVS